MLKHITRFLMCLTLVLLGMIAMAVLVVRDIKRSAIYKCCSSRDCLKQHHHEVKQ